MVAAYKQVIDPCQNGILARFIEVLEGFKDPNISIIVNERENQVFVTDDALVKGLVLVVVNSYRLAGRWDRSSTLRDCHRVWQG